MSHLVYHLKSGAVYRNEPNCGEHSNEQLLFVHCPLDDYERAEVIRHEPLPPTTPERQLPCITCLTLTRYPVLIELGKISGWDWKKLPKPQRENYLQIRGNEKI